MATATPDPPTVEPPAIPVKRPWPFATRIAIVTCLFLSLAIAAPILTQLKFEEDVTNWLPADDPQARLLAWHRQHFPADETILIAWDGSTLGDSRLESLANSLRD
ncbi:MAG: hypothetical protein M3552_21635, partial [Planctomycetota bacterium]|nr:hypothetical protein [Planctomycetota bacterium]